MVSVNNQLESLKLNCLRQYVEVIFCVIIPYVGKLNKSTLAIHTFFTGEILE